MLTRNLIFILLLLTHFDAWTQFIQTDSAIRSRIQKDIYILASDSLQGRKSGTTGEAKAYTYIISEFRKAGLQPHGTDSGSFLQTFPLESWDYGNKWQGNRMKVNGDNYTYILDFGATSLSANGTFSGHLVVLPQGTDHKDILKKIDVAPLSGIVDPFVLIDLRGCHDSIHPGQKLTRGALKMICGKIFSRGISGILLWDSKAAYYKDLFDFRENDSLPGPVIFLSREKGKKLSGDKFNRLVEVKISKPVYHIEDCHNVIGYLDNKAPYTIIFGAHYDHLGLNRKKEVSYGADDNASGTAAIMELARYLKNSGDRSSNYLFIAFSGEEEWLVGSNYFCEHPTLDLKGVSYMFNFDMVGRLGCEGNRVTAIGTYSSVDWKNIFSSLPKQKFRIKKMKGAASFSDHYGFYKKGIPVAYLTTGLHYDYHTSRDVAAKINYDGMVQVIKYAEDFIRRSEAIGRISFRKVPGWYQFTSTTHYIFEELDYIFTVGGGGAE